MVILSLVDARIDCTSPPPAAPASAAEALTAASLARPTAGPRSASSSIRMLASTSASLSATRDTAFWRCHRATSRSLRAMQWTLNGCNLRANDVEMFVNTFHDVLLCCLQAILRETRSQHSVGTTPISKTLQILGNWSHENCHTKCGLEKLESKW